MRYVVYYQAINYPGRGWYNAYTTPGFYDDGTVNYWLIPGTWED